MPRDLIGSAFVGKKWLDSRLGLTSEVEDIYLSLQTFFKKRTWHAGGRIAPDVLFTERNFRLVNNVPLDDAIGIAYKSIAATKTLARTKYSKDYDIKLCVRVLRECRNCHIPYNHQGGIFLLYLELCENVVLL